MPSVDRLPDPYTCTAAVLLVRREAGGPLLAVRGPRGLGFPGGKREPWESPIACALREAREECGLELSAAAARYIGERRTTAGHAVALIWLPPIGAVDLVAGPAGAPEWADPVELGRAPARHPDWNAWAVAEAERYERDPAPFDAEREVEPDIAAMLADAAEAAARRAARAAQAQAPAPREAEAGAEAAAAEAA